MMPEPPAANDPKPDFASNAAQSTSLAAAAFLAQALGLADRPEDIAADLDPLTSAVNTAIHAAEMESSIGPAAFLVYTYLLDVTDAEGRTGAELYDQGREALQIAADRNTPGPRMVAHARTDAFGFILATTPGTWRALNGETEPTPVPQGARPTARQRARTAQDLHRALKEANDLARVWLAGVEASGTAGGDVSEEEVGLALHVLDDANVRPLLTALNLLIASAGEQAARIAPRDKPEA